MIKLYPESEKLSGYFFGVDKMKRFLKLLALLLCSCLVFSGLGLKAEAAGVYRQAGVISVSRGGLNVRSSPSTSSSVKKVMLKGEYVTLISKSGNWWYVQYAAGSYGYCSADYISVVAESYEAYVATNSGRLNIRSGASTSASVKTTLPKGEKVVVLSSSGDFYKILYNGRYIGYASARYIKAVSNDSISLAVPKYYQTDSRWAKKEVGDSGRTIGDIGCTITCLAMAESFRTGAAVTPDLMEAKLRFTSGGALYWPSNYNLYSGAERYAKIAEILRSGRPVIYGGRNSSGGSHWVVITGFKGGELIPSNFIINDPATSRNTTLSQHIAKYPNFIRIAYAD